MEVKTVNLRDMPGDLVRRAKAYAALQGLSLKQFIIETLGKRLDEAGTELGSTSLLVAHSLRKTSGKHTRKQQKGKGRGR